MASTDIPLTISAYVLVSSVCEERELRSSVKIKDEVA